MLLNQHTTDKTETFFASAEQYVYSYIMNRHIRSSGAVRDFRHIALRWSARMCIPFSIDIALR